MRVKFTTASGARVGYDYLVVCPGIQLDWGVVPGMADAMTSPAASSNYTYDLAPKTWENIKALKSGRALFTQPSGPIKCAGAPQKIAYLAADYWRQQGVLKDIEITLVLPTPGMFGVKVFSDELERVGDEFGDAVFRFADDLERERDVVVDAQVRQQAEVLEHVADGLAQLIYLLAGKGVDVEVVEEDVA